MSTPHELSNFKRPSMSVDKYGIKNSVSRVYALVNQQKGREWYDHKSYVPIWHPPNDYDLLKKVGRGKYSTVWKAFYKRKRLVAIKVLVPLDPKRYLREIKILENLKGGPNIVKLLDLVQDPQTRIYSFIFEWVDFYDWRSLYRTFTIEDIRLYMYKLLVALEHSHSNGIMHRDVKPQNIAIDKKRQRLRLLDWGLADFYHPNVRYNSHVATRVFKPPELLIEYPYYDYSMDIWSAGLTFSIMMFQKIVITSGEDDGDQLFKVADLVGGAGIVEYAEGLNIELTNEARSKLLKITGTGWAPFVEESKPTGLCPPDALDLLEKMTAIDHRQRITAKEALSHPFIHPPDWIDQLKSDEE